MFDISLLSRQKQYPESSRCNPISATILNSVYFTFCLLYGSELELGLGFSGQVQGGFGSKLITSNFVRNFLNSMI